MKLHARVGDVQAGAIQSRRFGLYHIQLFNSGTAQYSARKIAPSRPQIGHTSGQFGRQYSRQQNRSAVRAIRRKHPGQGDKAFGQSLRNRRPNRQRRARSNHRQLAMRLGNDLSHRHTQSGHIAQHRFHPIGFLTVHHNPPADPNGTRRHSNHRARRRFGAGKADNGQTHRTIQRSAIPRSGKVILIRFEPGDHHGAGFGKIGKIIPHNWAINHDIARQRHHHRAGFQRHFKSCRSHVVRLAPAPLSQR